MPDAVVHCVLDTVGITATAGADDTAANAAAAAAAAAVVHAAPPQLVCTVAGRLLRCNGAARQSQHTTPACL
jgi:hypothetical protein